MLYRNIYRKQVMKWMAGASPGKCVAALFMTAFVCIAGQNDDTSDSTFSGKDPVGSLDDVTVTGSATSMATKKVPASVTVLSADDPEFNGITTVDDALSRVPGVYVDRSRGLTTTGSHTQVSLRGTSAANRTLVMKDGIPLNNSYTGSITEWNTIATNSIGKIEVVKGAASALYGSGAMGGVINMITEDPKEQPALAASASYGSMNTMLFNAKAGKTFTNGFGAIVFAEVKHTGGYRYMEDGLWQSYYKKPENTMMNATLKCDYDFKNRSRIEFVSDYHQENPTTGTTTLYDMNNKTGNFLLRYTTSVLPVDADLTAYTNHAANSTDADKWNRTDSAFSTEYYDTDVPYSETGFVGKVTGVAGWNTFSFGVDARLYAMESKYDYPSKGTSAYEGRQVFGAAFVNDDIAVGDAVFINLGLRYDYWQNRDGKFGDNTSGTTVAISYPKKTSNVLSPRGGIVIKPGELFRLRAAVSTGFKAPSMYYLYRSAPHGATSFDLGNPDLKPERMLYSLEAGEDITISDKIEFSVTAHASSFRDFLDKVSVDPSDVPSYFSPGEGVIVNQSVNIGKVNLYGAETSLRHRLHPTGTLVLGYSYTRSRILKYEVDPSLEGNALEDNPEHAASAGFRFDSPKLFTAGLWLKYVGERFSDMENSDENKIDAYFLLNLYASRSFLGNRLTVSFSVDNLLDRQYYGYYGSNKSYYYGPPRTVTGGISFRL